MIWYLFLFRGGQIVRMPVRHWRLIRKVAIFILAWVGTSEYAFIVVFALIVRFRFQGFCVTYHTQYLAEIRYS